MNQLNNELKAYVNSIADDKEKLHILAQCLDEGIELFVETKKRERIKLRPTRGMRHSGHVVVASCPAFC